ncbi:hypothetical protein CH306_26640 [Rhodococcus sp. 15-725-2-2b]|uniref:TetR/AcrR family transcriptional regulator n=1 Tax=unclassified Rhodococcus (in: high G+C Gram-positive bacteria) TaxID=192944 RepID=UPI000B9C10B1|nr:MULTISPECIES: TetR/AcrR family transcriptional regulator [unclassified Rhodococcus (in: high G+C Gram-positive bacteria)]OZC63545.1 hypothetical protein CH277_22020 [Rhodococcus sp. 06-469-3-2]OZD40710.1 hypothetical protein CH264_23705 [Rhodococcus sp. 06-1477-1A]OZE67182.1 hypothetical protein CH306_26640 [Rhodococcus sp. 15-725-2-2b]
MAAGVPARASSRDAILLVFAELVAERGYSDTSLSEVAGVLGLSKGTIVHHFTNKEQMLSEVHAAYFERRFAEASFIEDQLDDPVTELAAVIYALLAAHRDDRAASLAFLREFVRFVEGGLSEHVRERRVAYRRLVVEIIARGCESGQLRTSDPLLSAMHVFGMCNYAWTWYRPAGRQTIEDIADVLIRDVLNGLQATGPGLPDLDTVVTTAIDTVRRAPGRLPPANEARRAMSAR